MMSVSVLYKSQATFGKKPSHYSTGAFRSYPSNLIKIAITIITAEKTLDQHILSAASSLKHDL